MHHSVVFIYILLAYVMLVPVVLAGLLRLFRIGTIGEDFGPVGQKDVGLVEQTELAPSLFQVK